MTAPAAARRPTIPPVVVIGAGWAGLAAAVELADAGITVHVIEASRQPGGRARAAPFGDYRVDNGQHLLIGAYREAFRLMTRVGAAPDSVLKRLPLTLQIAGTCGPLRIAAPNLPAPLHLAGALLGARGLSWRERLAAVRLGRRLAAGDAASPEQSVRQWLLDSGQPERVRRLIWEPLCLAALNTPAERACAHTFARVLHDSFARRRTDSDLLIPRVDLGRLFPVPAVDFIEQRGGTVQFGHRVDGLEVHGGEIHAVRVDGELLPARAVILATAPSAAAKLLAGCGLKETANQINQLGHEPITTVYLHYPGQRLPFPMMGLSGTTTEWVFDRGVADQPGLLAAVISAGGPHMALNKEALIARVTAELQHHLGLPAQPQAANVIREKRATFACEVGSAALRPHTDTSLTNLFLAGDYVATGYPATLEGAVISGVQCARRIVDNAHLDPLPAAKPDS